MALLRGFLGPNVQRLKAKGDANGLIKAPAYERDPSVRQTAARALGELRAKEALGPLGDSLTDPSPLVRRSAIYAQSVALREELFDQRPGNLRAAQELVNALLGQAQVVGNQGQTHESQQILVRCREPLRLLHRAGRLEHPYLKNLYGQLG